MDQRRFVIVVADSAGCGAMPDARAYGDEGSDTIGNTSRAVGGLALPNLARLGLGHLTAIAGVPPDPAPAGLFGKMQERSQGKDSVTGHWEMMGIVLREGLRTFPQGFPPDIIEPWLPETVERGLVFVNLVDFDMLYGHRNDAPGYGRALEELDRALPRLLERLRPGDVFVLTADHGCDPTTPSTDHSREYVPLLVHAPGRAGGA